MNLQEAKHFLEQNDVRYVLAQFVNIHGVSKTKAVVSTHQPCDKFVCIDHCLSLVSGTLSKRSLLRSNSSASKTDFVYFSKE